MHRRLPGRWRGLEQEGVVVRRAAVLASVLALVLVACGGGQDGGSGAAASRAVSTAEPVGEPIVIRMSLVIAAVEGAEITATGKVLEGSTRGVAPFCASGTIEERHADPNEAPPRLLDRTITCPDGTVTLGITPEVGLTPEPPKDRPQGGSWTIVSGTGTFEGLGGSGEMEVTYDPGNEPGKESLAQATLTGSVTR
jgi:hypothetical protein